MRIPTGDSFIAIMRKAYALEPSIGALFQAHAMETPAIAGSQADGPGDLDQAPPDFNQAFPIERAR